MKGWTVLLPLVWLSGCDDLVGVDCNVDRRLSDVIGVSGTDRVRVIGQAGELRVEGRAGLSEVRVFGDACAEDRLDLDDVDLIVERIGGEVRVLGLVPSAGRLRARLDLVVEVPDWMLVEIEHNEGDIRVDNVAGLDVSDDSGNLRVRDIRGDLFVLDGSGWVDVFGVDGNVVIDDDDSGDLTIRAVDNDIHVLEHGSGDILVEDILGDFRVDLDRGGTISFRNVVGQVIIPR